MREGLRTVNPENNESHRSGLRGRIGKIATAATAALALLGIGEAVRPVPAQAAAYADSVSAPRWEGDTVSATANVNKDCEGTVGCWSYVKIEYRADHPGMPEWLKKWRYLDGHWAQDGENTVIVPTQEGCGEYRMVVDSYNDFYHEQGSYGVSAGARGAEINVENIRHGVDRLHVRSAAAAYICNLA